MGGRGWERFGAGRKAMHLELEKCIFSGPAEAVGCRGDPHLWALLSAPPPPAPILCRVSIDLSILGTGPLQHNSFSYLGGRSKFLPKSFWALIVFSSK